MARLEEMNTSSGMNLEITTQMFQNQKYIISVYSSKVSVCHSLLIKSVSLSEFTDQKCQFIRALYKGTSSADHYLFHLSEDQSRIRQTDQHPCSRG